MNSGPCACQAGVYATELYPCLLTFLNAAMSIGVQIPAQLSINVHRCFLHDCRKLGVASVFPSRQTMDSDVPRRGCYAAVKVKSVGSQNSSRDFQPQALSEGSCCQLAGAVWLHFHGLLIAPRTGAGDPVGDGPGGERIWAQCSRGAGRGGLGSWSCSAT